jgi:hypothetical protein
MLRATIISIVQSYLLFTLDYFAKGNSPSLKNSSAKTSSAHYQYNITNAAGLTEFQQQVWFYSIQILVIAHTGLLFFQTTASAKNKFVRTKKYPNIYYTVFIIWQLNFLYHIWKFYFQSDSLIMKAMGIAICIITIIALARMVKWII